MPRTAKSETLDRLEEIAESAWERYQHLRSTGAHIGAGNAAELAMLYVQATIAITECKRNPPK